MLKFHISDGSWTFGRLFVRAEGQWRRESRRLKHQGDISGFFGHAGWFLSRRRTRRSRRRRKRRTVGINTAQQVTPETNYGWRQTTPFPRQPLCAPFPGRLRRKAKSTGDAGRRSHGGVRVARQPFALSSTTVMDRARLRPYHHHHHHHHHHHRHVTTTWRDFKLFSHRIGIVCHVYDRQQLDRWMPCYDITEELEELN